MTILNIIEHKVGTPLSYSLQHVTPPAAMLSDLHIDNLLFPSRRLTSPSQGEYKAASPLHLSEMATYTSIKWIPGQYGVYR
jgi:hypothetical protein